MKCVIFICCRNKYNFRVHLCPCILLIKDNVLAFFSKFNTAEEVLRAAKFMVAMQLSHDPLVRKCVRETFFESAKINIKPTMKGIKEIDENHPCYR
jgi:transcriptional accessory protein Tex/SPT6